MGWYLVALIAVPILATLWAVGFGVMAVRERKIIWRLLCGLQALVGVIFAAAGWLLLGWVFGTGGGSLVGLAVEEPQVTRFGWFFLAVLGALAFMVLFRKRRMKLQGRS